MLITITFSQYTQDCLFYASPLICTTVIQNNYEIRELFLKLRDQSKSAKVKIPVMKRKTIDLKLAMALQQKEVIDI